MLQLLWFTQVRWAFLLAQGALVIGTAWLLPDHFPAASLLALLFMVAGSNFVLMRCARAADSLYSTVVPAAICFDVAMLALALSLTGGHANPFCSFFLIHITLAAVLMNARWMWFTLALSTAFYGGLFLMPITLPEVSLHPHHGGASLHLVGMLISFLMTAIILGFFLGRLSKQLAESRAKAARLSEIAAVGRLAASTAHELASPLNTVALALENLCQPRILEQLELEGREDVLLANQELRRANQILKAMPSHAGLTPGEQPSRFDLSELAAPLAEAGATIVDGSGAVVLPRQGLVCALTNLIRNSRQAGANAVHVFARVHGPQCLVTVNDDGAGLPSDIAPAQLVEPFVGTKAAESGAGLGLGLFIVQTFAQDLGGAFNIAPRSDAAGTSATLTLPREIS